MKTRQKFAAAGLASTIAMAAALSPADAANPDRAVGTAPPAATGTMAQGAVADQLRQSPGGIHNLLAPPIT